MTTVRHEGLGLDRLAEAMKTLDGLTAKVGWLETAKYPDGTPVAYVAAIHEYGYPEGGIPPRPTMRPTVAARQSAWIKKLGAGAKAVLRGDITADVAMLGVGLVAAGDVSKAIATLQSPPLAPSTIEAKGFKKPLVDTGLMFQSLTAVVERDQAELQRREPNAGQAPPR